MKKIKLYISISFDQYIARANGDVTWLDLPEYLIRGMDYGRKEFYDSVDTTIMGHTTYKMITGFNKTFPYADKKNYVFTKNRSLKSNNDVEYIIEDLASFANRLKRQPGKDIFLVGGGQINQILLNYNLIDEMILNVIPIMLGHGVKLFHGVVKEKKLNLVDSYQYPNGVIQLKYIK